eukprot:103806-Prorocentrum_lima.AAC.1
MTSSLVGSEMCIRDSPYCETCTRSKMQRRPGRRVKPGASRGPLPTAVSYTHLTLPTICSV